MEVMPAVNQIESHVLFQQKQMRKILKKYGTQLMAWSPLVQGREELLGNNQLASIGKKYEKTTAQVAPRFLIQSGAIAIPKAIHRDRMEENMAIFDFSLTSEEMKELRVCFKSIKVTKQGYRQGRQRRENRVLSSHTWWQNGGCFST